MISSMFLSLKSSNDSFFLQVLSSPWSPLSLTPNHVYLLLIVNTALFLLIDNFNTLDRVNDHHNLNRFTLSQADNSTTSLFLAQV